MLEACSQQKSHIVVESTSPNKPGGQFSFTTNLQQDQCVRQWPINEARLGCALVLLPDVAYDAQRLPSANRKGCDI